MDHPFTDPMQPWPTLAKYAQTVDLPENKIKLFLYDAGPPEWPAIVLLHGLGDEADTWRHLVEPLARHYRVIAPDLPGFGRSAKPPIDYSLPFLSAVIIELLDVLAVTKGTLIGNSLGAMIAQMITIDHPERIQRLVLVDGSLWIPKQGLRLENLLYMIPGLGEWLYTRLRKDPQAAYNTLYPYYHHLDGLPGVEQEFLYQRVNQRVWDNDQRRAYFSVMRNMAVFIMRQRGQLKERLAALRTPTLIVWGQNDRLIPLENAHALVQIMPNARLATLPQTGHVPQQENPQALLERILEDGRFTG